MDFNQIEMKYKLKEKGLKLEKKNIFEAIDFYKSLILDSLFLNDYYQFKRLSILYHKLKDYEMEVKIIKYFLNSGIYCNKIQFLSFKYKLKKLSKYGHISLDEINDALESFKNNGLNNKDESEQPVVTARRIEKVAGSIRVVDESKIFYGSKKPFLRAIANGLYDEELYQEAFDLYNLMIYNFGYVDFRFFRKLCGIYRRTGNYKHELLVIKEYFNDPRVNKSKSSEKWFTKRLESSRELIGDEELFDSIFNSAYKKGEHLFCDFPLKNLKVNLDTNFTLKEFDDYFNFKLESPDDIFRAVKDIKKSKSKKTAKAANGSRLIESARHEEKSESKSDNKRVSVSKSLGVKREFSFVCEISEDYLPVLEKPVIYYEYDKSLSNSDNINRKAYLMNYGGELFKEKRYDDCISYFESLKSNSYFENDWYPYEQLAFVYDKAEMYPEDLDNIKEVLSSNIYLNNFQYLWITDKFRKLKKHIEISETEIEESVNYYESHGAKNKEKTDTPIVQADRIKKGRKYWVLSEEAFDIESKINEIIYTGKALEKQEKYETAINLYSDKYNGDFPIMKLFKRICYCLEKLGDYETELEHLKYYYKNPPKDISEKSDIWIEKRISKVNKKLGTDYTVEDLNK
ncbi:MAG: hypothetical protein IKV87_03055 [Methanobrevibacter sp.]|nr:hypothetical protein [Methanobrevibacter sp.]